MTWLNPKSTRVASGLVESKEHWVAGGLVDSKEHRGGDYTKRWCREVDNFKWTRLREVWSMDKDRRF
jgi:hypothetical protein